MKRVYVAGAISNPDVTQVYNNKRRMKQLGKDVSVAGYSPFVPCLDEELHHLMNDKENDMACSCGFYYPRSMAWLEVSDAVVLVRGWENSIGTQKEIERAKELGIPVYNSLQELIDSDIPHIHEPAIYYHESQGKDATCRVQCDNCGIHSGSWVSTEEFAWRDWHAGIRKGATEL
jgi:Domain of unknown function (DUF4406)